MKQKSIKKAGSLSGQALHSGKLSSLTFMPEKPDRGISFLYKGRRIPALAENVTGTERGTWLGEIGLVEHVLAAVRGLGIDNLAIELSAPEPPNIDGSALPFVEALKECGICLQEAEISAFVLNGPIKLESKEASLEALPQNGFVVDFMVNFPAIGHQHFVFEGDFAKEIAPARTFGYIEELDNLRRRGLARGASPESVLGISQKGYMNAPRFPDEPVRHKILDLIGDLALVGMPVLCKVIARKSGHSLNLKLARLLREAALRSKQGG